MMRPADIEREQPDGRRRVVVCSNQVPQANRDSGSRRLLHFLDVLQNAGWAVSFLAADGIGNLPDADVLRRRSVHVHDGVHDRTEELFNTGWVDLALIAFWTMRSDIC